jgi:hypothetical protein
MEVVRPIKLGGLRRLAEQCGRAVRLANDLVSLPRELMEGSVNTVALLARRKRSRDASMSQQERLDTAANDVTEQLHRELGRIHTLAELASGSGPEQRYVRVAELGVAFYGWRDVRDWSPPPAGKGVSS